MASNNQNKPDAVSALSAVSGAVLAVSGGMSAFEKFSSGSNLLNIVVQSGTSYYWQKRSYQQTSEHFRRAAESADVSRHLIVPFLFLQTLAPVLTTYKEFAPQIRDALMSFEDRVVIIGSESLYSLLDSFVPGSPNEITTQSCQDLQKYLKWVPLKIAAIQISWFKCASSAAQDFFAMCLLLV